MFTADHPQNPASAPKSPAASIQKGRAPTDDAPATLERLLPDLRRIAAQRAAGAEIDADDLLQNIAEDVLVYQRRTRRLENRSYHLQRAWHRAANFARAARAYRRYVSVMPVCVDPYGFDIDLSDLLPAPDATPEERIIAAESLAHLRARLTQTQYRIVTLLLAGYSRSETAAELGVCPPTLSYHLTQIRQRISARDIYSPNPTA